MSTSGTIGQAALILKADNADLVKGLNSSKSQMVDFHKAVESSAKRVANSWKSIISGVAAGFTAGITGPIVGAATSMLSLSQAAEKAREAVQHTLQLYHEAQSTGASLSFVQGLDAMSDEGNRIGHFMERVARLQHEAVEGNDAARATFDALRISWQDLRGASPETVLLRTADAIAAMDNASRTAALHQLGGRNAASLIPLLQRGSAGITEELARGRQMGIGVDERAAEVLRQAEVTHRTFAAAQESLTATRRAAWIREHGDGSQNQFFAGWRVALAGGGADWFVGGREFAAENRRRARSLGIMTRPEVQRLDQVSPGYFERREEDNLRLAASTAARVAQEQAAAQQQRVNFALDRDQSAMLQQIQREQRAVGLTAREAAIAQFRAREIADGGTGNRANRLDTANATVEAAKAMEHFRRQTDAIGATSGEAMVRQLGRIAGMSREMAQELYAANAQTEFMRRAFTASTQIAEFGMTQAQRATAEFGRITGVAAGQVEKLRDRLDTLEGLQIGERFDHAGTMQRELARVNDLYSRGKITAEVWAQSTEQSTNRAAQALNMRFQNPAALFAGSQQAVSAMLQVQSPVMNHQDRVMAIQQQQHATQQQILEALRANLPQMRVAAERDAGNGVRLAVLN